MNSTHPPKTTHQNLPLIIYHSFFLLSIKNRTRMRRLTSRLRICPHLIRLSGLESVFTPHWEKF